MVVTLMIFSLFLLLDNIYEISVLYLSNFYDTLKLYVDEFLKYFFI